jgi:hypothetical protein
MKTIFVLVLFMVVALGSMGQDTTEVDNVAEQKARGFDKSKLYYGGYLNMSFGRYTAIGAAPLLGYKVTPKFSVGTKFSYEYINDKRFTQDYSTSNYGFSLFSRLRVTSKLYGHVEFATMNYDLYNEQGESDREWIPFLFVGGGYSRKIAKNTWLNAQILWDVIQDDKSPYKTYEPFYSIGLGVGF